MRVCVVRACVCVCVPLRLLITCSMIWTPYDKFYNFYLDYNRVNFEVYKIT